MKSNLKKSFCLFLCILILFGVTSCTSEAPSLIGTWECEDFNTLASMGMNAAGSLTDLGFLGDLGKNIDVSAELTFFENGTYRMEMYISMFMFSTDTESISGHYTWENNVLIMDGQNMNAKLSSKELTVSERHPDGYNIKLTFTKKD